MRLRFGLCFKGQRLYFVPRLDSLETLHDQAFSRFQPLADQPFVTDGAVDLQRPLFHLAGAVCHQGDGIPFLVAGDPLLWDEDRPLVHAFSHDGADVHARQQDPLRIREDRAQGDRSGPGIDGYVGKFQDALRRIGGPVFQQQLDLCLAGIVMPQPAAGHASF